MAKEKGLSYENLQESYRQMRSYASALQTAGGLENLTSAAVGIANEVGEPLAVQALQEGSMGPEYTAFAQIGAKRAQKEFEDLTSPENLESILSTVPMEKLEEILSYIPQLIPDPEKVDGSYKDVVKLHYEVTFMKQILDYIEKGDVNRKQEEAYAPVMLRALNEHFNEQYPDDKDEEKVAIKNALLKLAVKSDKYRTGRYVQIAPKLLEKKMKEFRKKLGGDDKISKAKLAGYISGVLPKEKISGIYQLLLQEKESR